MKLFQVFDTDHSNELGIEEFQKLLSFSCKQNLSEEEILKNFNVIDLSGECILYMAR